MESKDRNPRKGVASDYSEERTSLQLASERSCPTILEMSQLKAGARKRWAQKQSPFDRSEKSDDMVELMKGKLASARCLQVARNLGCLLYTSPSPRD